jgi:adenosylmethionine-8-amino-7-oxononanoate aminotransferase
MKKNQQHHGVTEIRTTGLMKAITIKTEKGVKK